MAMEVTALIIEFINPFSYKRNVEDLLSRMEVLISLRMKVLNEVNVAPRSGHTIRTTVSYWLQKVDMILREAEELSFQVYEITSCFKGWCCGRYRLGRKARNLRYMVDELLDEMKEIGVEHLAPPLTTILRHAEDFGADIFNKDAMNKVMDALSHDKISIIGVVGMGGIGKTTLIKKIAIQVKEEKKFDSVIMVCVSQNPNLRRIQDDIAAQLFLEFETERRESRAKKLFKLMQEKRVLIFLDDLWMELDLIEVGIPVGKFHTGCKVVLTTRSIGVCETMGVQATIQLKCLSDEDSWNLFKAIAGIDVNNYALNEVGRQVAEKCRGLPLALVTVGRALRNKDLREWDYALKQLRVSDMSDMPPVFSTIKLIYDNFPGENMKFVFLYCCIFPEDRQIGTDELLRCLVGEGFFEDADFDQAETILHEMIEGLISSSLLMKGDMDGFFIMHDIIRDVAITIASEDHGFVIKTGKGYNMWPEKKVLQNCLRLSLMESDISELPERPDCSAIKTLTLSRCHSLKIIPDNFFEEMKSLVNLDLSYTPIVALPSSIKCLENLRTLCLDGCSSLKDISVIGKLKTLEIISLKKTSTEKLSARELQEFPNLKLIAT